MLWVGSPLSQFAEASFHIKFLWNTSACMLKASLNWILEDIWLKLGYVQTFWSLSDHYINFEWILHTPYSFWAASKINWCADTNLFCSNCIKWTLWKRSIFFHAYQFSQISVNIIHWVDRNQKSKWSRLDLILKEETIF